MCENYSRDRKDYAYYTHDLHEKYGSVKIENGIYCIPTYVGM